jgi:hypothetical protein
MLGEVLDNGKVFIVRIFSGENCVYKPHFGKGG